MPSLVNAETDERDALLAFLAAQRGGLRRAVLGLSEEQAAGTPTVSSLSLAVLIKHAARCERFWITENLLQRGGGEESASMERWADEYRLVEGDTLAGWLAVYEQVAAETEKAVRELPSLEVDFPLPVAPWFPPNSRRTARWALLHLIQETARHAGHADIIRETVDGKVAFQLLAEEQGTPWN
ncbi:DinB family protein [Kitasatospora terrestris]|uniref:DinB family protein n=1 Tax=Kitasatospora terrestris TaxID=258051 RepID=A0ABP9DPB1_9ACTN